MKNKVWIFVALTVIVLNFKSILKKNGKFTNLIEISKQNYSFLSKISVNEVYSNSFGFISSKKITLPKGVIMKIINTKTKEVILFLPKIVKHKDTLFFLQAIDWITIKKTKIKKGNYNLYIVNE